MIKVVINVREIEGGGDPNIRVIYFNDVDINLKFDSVANTFKLKMYFDPLNEDHAEIAGVSHMHECKIYYVHDISATRAVRESDDPKRSINPVGDVVVNWQDYTTVFYDTKEELILTGLIISQLFVDAPPRNWVELGGYSKCGVIAECDLPVYSKDEIIGMSFREIVNNCIMIYFNKSVGGFKFKIKSSRADEAYTEDPTSKKKSTKLPSDISELIKSIQGKSDKIIPKTTVKNPKNVLSFLKQLAVPKGITLSSDIFGNLIANVPYTGNDYLFTIGTGFSDISFKKMEMTLCYNGQNLHSYIEVNGQPQTFVAKSGKASPNPKPNQVYTSNGSYAIVNNPLVPVIVKPRLVDSDSGDDNEAMEYAISELGSELKSIFLKIVLHDPALNGKFITPNNTILVKNKRCYLYEPSKWFIEEVNYKKSTTETRVELICVLPGVYGGVVKNIFVPAGKNLPDVKQ